MEGMGGNKDMMLLLSLVVHEVRRASQTAQNRGQCLLKIDGSTEPPTKKKEWPLEVLLLGEAGWWVGAPRKRTHEESNSVATVESRTQEARCGDIRVCRSLWWLMTLA